MSDKPVREIMDILHAREPQAREFQQKFDYKGKPITHQNLLEVEKTVERTEQLEIRNHFVTIEGDRVVKLTEIQFDDRIVRIVDSFSTIYEQHDIKTHNIESKVEETARIPIQRKNILEKKQKTLSTKEGHQEFKIRDTKNVVKNIYRLFQNWVKDNTPSELDLRGSLKSLLKKNGKYNNNLVMSIAMNPELRKAFMDYSTDEGQELIKCSRIIDKESHLQALHKYRLICSDQQLDQEMKESALKRRLELRNENGEEFESEGVEAEQQ